MSHQPASRGPLVLALSAAAGVAAFAWVVSVGRGAHLLHFDAKAHLVVARRVLDSLTPGWTQLGVVWLPLPQILNVLPAQNDHLYATGLFASALGFACFVLGLAALGQAATRATGDSWAGVVAVALPALNPGWLYLQSTPLTEPLFFGLVGGLIFFWMRWQDSRRPADLWAAAVCSALACLVRYETWPLAALAMALAAWRDRGRRTIFIGLGVGWAAPILAYVLHCWITVGVPFVAITADNLTAERGPWRAVTLLIGGAGRAFGWPLLVALLVGLAALLARLADPERRLAPLGLVALAPALVTFVAYAAGHPEKARYALLLAPALALLLAAATAGRRWAQLAVLLLAALQGPLGPKPIPVLKEATRDRDDVIGRRPIVDAIRRDYHGGRILASMASLAPFLYDLQIPLRDVVHEGNGVYWDYAVVDPAREVEWVLIRQGDPLDQVREYRPDFPAGFVPVMGDRRLTVYRRAQELLPHEARFPRPPALPGVPAADVGSVTADIR
jgi:hypothetical protein